MTHWPFHFSFGRVLGEPYRKNTLGLGNFTVINNCCTSQQNELLNLQLCRGGDGTEGLKVT
jgi:hypothetical protein